MLYGAYGSNLHPGRLQRRVPSARLLGQVKIDGWGLRFHKLSKDGSGKCSIEPTAATSLVYLAVYEMESAELPLLDQAEGLGNGYQHFELTLPRFGKTLTYLAQQSHIDGRLRPYRWYKEYVLAGAEFNRLDRTYIQAIQQITHWDDKDLERHTQHMGRIRRLPGAPA